MAEMISVKVTGQDELVKYFQRLSTKSHTVWRAAIQDGCLVIDEAARKLAPVDTGRMRDSISIRVTAESLRGEITGEVGTNVKYAPYVEFGPKRHLALIRRGPGKGTKFRWAGGQFLAPAFQNNFDRIKKIFENAVEGAIKE